MIPSFFEWFDGAENSPIKPWLILGKGPSFSKRDEFDLSGFNLLALNHAVRELKAKISHVIDLDVIFHCGEEIVKNAEFLVMPWYPHVGHRPGHSNLEEICEKIKILKYLHDQKRLLYYNLSTADVVKNNSPIVSAKFFSAEAATNILAIAGVKMIRTLGVDGGASYSEKFEDLKSKTLLANARSSFDQQFEEISKTIFSKKLDFAPLDIESPIRVFIATENAQMLSTKVLEYSIKKQSSITTNVIPINELGIEIPTPRDVKNRPRTPFSFQRFLIPEACGFNGRAIYLDSDMQVFTDIRKLWTLPFGKADLLAVRASLEAGRRPQFSVMLLDCERLHWSIVEIVRELDEGALTYEDLMYEMKVAKQVEATIDPAWNCLELYDEKRSALTHYTDMERQPWVSTVNPLAYIWVKELREAINVGFIGLDYLKDHISRGYVRPSLLYQVENGIDDPLILSKKALKLDENYEPPYTKIHLHRGSPWTKLSRRLAYIASNRLGGSQIRRVARRLPSAIRKGFHR